MGFFQQAKRFRRFFFLFWGLFFGAFLIFFLYLSALSRSSALPSFEQLENPQSALAAEIYSSDGMMLGKYFRENRSNVSFDDLPDHLVNALVATEDVRFNKHSGVDLRALFRVVATFGSSGGSTLTQQLAKNLYSRPPNMTKLQLVRQKFMEWITATQLEKRYTKDEILTMYLNTVPFIYDAYGIKSAARTFFSKEVEELTVEEGAVFVGMLKNPSLYNPKRRNELTFNRRNTVLSQMEKYGYLDAAICDSVKQLPLDMSRFARQDHNTGYATYFREHLRGFLTDWASKNTNANGEPYDIYSDGLKIYTTIDSRMQRHAELAMEEWMGQLQPTFLEHWGAKYSYAPWTYPENDRKDPNFLKKKMRRTDRYRAMKNNGASESEIEKAFNTPVEMSLFSWNKDDLKHMFKIPEDAVWDSVRREITLTISPMDSLNYTKRMLHAGFMAMDPKSGHIRAWVGGINHSHYQFDHVNINARRQVGSTFKPFVYATAIKEKGISPCRKVPNIPVTFSPDDPRFAGMPEPWTPRNSGEYKAGEMVSLTEGLANSINSITAFLMKEVGVSPVIELAQNMGISNDIPPGPAICLGTPELSLFEMVGAYTTYANKGVWTQPAYIARIEDKNGIEIATFASARQTVMEEEEAWVMINLLQDVVSQGTGQRIHRDPYGKIPYDVQLGGKTGTTQQHSDGWFMGVVPKLVFGAWVGADDPVVAFRNIGYGQGANMALPICGRFLSKVLNDKELNVKIEDAFQAPDFPSTIEIDCTRYEEEQQEQQNPYEELDDLFGSGIPQ